MYNIPSKINSFNVYRDSTRLIGISDEVNLPEFAAKTDTINGPGILGEVDDPALGHFGSMEMEIPFRVLDQDLFSLCDDSNSVTLTMRGGIQYTVSDTCATATKQMRIVVRGKNKGITGGTAKQAAGTNSSIKLEIYYIMIEIGGIVEIELDKLNYIYKVHGRDLMERIRRMC
jgi:hypothetical protein